MNSSPLIKRSSISRKSGLNGAGPLVAREQTASGIAIPDCSAETNESIASGHDESRNRITALALFLWSTNGMAVDNDVTAIDIVNVPVITRTTEKTRRIENTSKAVLCN